MFMSVIKYYETAKHKVGDKHINQCLSPTLLIFADVYSANSTPFSTSHLPRVKSGISTGAPPASANLLY